MSRLNLFTFNSERADSPRSLMLVGAWIVVSLVVIDVLINIFFHYPTDPNVINPSQLQSYFEYGRSSEGKLARMTRADPSQTAPITLSGWYEPLEVVQKTTETQNPVVTFYGMSHAVQLANALGRVSDRYIARSVGAPGATPNWSYGAFLRDHGGGKSRVVVLAFMSANLPMITSMSPMTWNIDFPMPYTADRFYLDRGQLKVIHPPFESFEQYVQAFSDPVKWSAARDLLAKNDAMYNSLIMRQTFLDNSSLFRLVRRAYGQRFVRNVSHGVLDRTGFNPDSEQIKIVNKIVQQFAEQARKDGMLPVIYIVNNLGYSDYMFQAIKLTLEADNIPYLSSHTVASPSDPRKYLPNSHFTDAVDEELAHALVKLMNKLLPQ